MSKNCKWGIFPGKWNGKAKKRLPRRIKKRGSLPRSPKADISRDASRFRRSDTARFQARFEGHSSVPKLGNDRTAFPEWTAGSGRETCLRVDSRHTPHAPPSGADFKTGCNDPNQADTRPPNCGLTVFPRCRSDAVVRYAVPFKDLHICPQIGTAPNKTDRRSERVRTPVCFAARRTSTAAGSCPPRVVFDSAQAAYVFLPLACQNIISTLIRLKSTSDSIADKASLL